jgi:hypothetical protein
MNELNFCYWLQGFFELKKTIDHREGFSPETVKVIEDHLNLVFNKVTPNRAITQELVDRFKQTPITSLPFPRLGDLPDGFALQATC